MTSKLYLFPLSDLHLGSAQCDLEFFDVWPKTFEQGPDNKAIYLLGDMLEFPTTRLDAYSTVMSTHDALERLMELLEPYKEYIRFVCTGNHEARSLREYNYDITRSIAERLDAQYTRSDFFDKVTEDDKELVIYGKHGTRISKNSQLSMNNFIRDMADIDANLCMQGHNHYCEFASNYRRGYESGDRRYYAFTGHFLKYDGYARHKGLPISQPSFLRLTIDNKLHIDAKKYYKDEVI
jgi:predicted MPP superfamily phosphohydrolase